MTFKRQITRRAVIYVTKLCNIHCKFCYYKYEESPKHAPFDSIERTFKWFKRDYQIDSVDITGGEPTIHPRIVDIVRSSLAHELKPTIITNAQKPRLIETLIDEGLQDLLISIHGTPRHHDEVVGKKGAYAKIMETIQILKKRNFPFRINMVLTRYSCPDIQTIAVHLKEIAPRIVNLIAFNPHEGSQWKDKVNVQFQVSYTQQAQAAQRAIDILDAAGIYVNVRYIPLCFMKGYEKHVCNFLQWQFDPYEWEYLSSHRIPPEEKAAMLERAKNENTFSFSNDGTSDENSSDEETLHHYAMKQHIKGNRFLPLCNQCANRQICDGIYPQYLAGFGEKEFSPTPGTPLQDPLAYKRLDTRWAKE